MSDFVRFLHNKGVLFAWCVNYHNPPTRSLEGYEDLWMIIDAFCWDSSPQGFGFWSGINDEWVEVFYEV